MKAKQKSMTSKKTYKDLITLLNQISLNVTDATTKGQKKLIKISEKIKPSIEKYNELVEETRLENASVDDKNNLVLDEKGEYKFTKEAIKKITATRKELLDKEFEFEPINVVNPQGLEQYIFLEGWVTGVSFTKEEEDEEL